jgi:hypothetical protein
MVGRPVALAGRAAVGAALALLLAGGGCYIPPGASKGGRLIPEASVKALRPGVTTKGELFERFGPPAAVLAPGETAELFPEDGRNVSIRPWGASVRMDADAVFELFPPATAEVAEYRRIHFFRRSKGDTATLMLVFWIDSGHRIDTDRLWVLVDERTRTVEDYAYRKAGGPTVFGLRRPPVTSGGPGRR